MKTIYNERLIKFAKHIEQINNHPEQSLFKTVTIVVLENQSNHQYTVKYPSWILDELVAIFEEWEFSERTGDPILAEPYKSEGSFEDFCDFFDLSLDEISLFDIDSFQEAEKINEPYVFDTNPQEIALKILLIVKIRKSEK